jgi:hypothetical protein
MKHPKAPLILSVALVTLAACATAEDLLIGTTELVQNGATSKAKKLEAARDELLPAYAKSVERFQDDIAFHKEETEINLERRNLAKAYESLVTLYDLTHPCGEDDCGTYPCEICLNDERGDLSMSPLNRLEIMLEREEIDNERAFIESATDQLFELAGAYLEERRFDELDGILDEYNPRVPLPSINRERFTERARNVKMTWVNVLVADADSVEAEHPAAATLFLAKAASLAGEIEDPSAEALGERVASLRARVVAERGYTIRVGSVRGPASKSLMARITNETFPGEIRVVDGAGRITVSLDVAPPRYARSIGRKTSSFRYVSGTKPAPNPQYARIKSKMEEAQRRTSGSGFAGSEEGRRDYIRRNQAEAQGLAAELASTPREIQVDVFSDYSYPVTLHHLDTTLDIGFELEHADGRRRMAVGSVKGRLTDEEHKSYSAGIPGKVTTISPDPADPPEESAGYDDAKNRAVSAGRDKIDESFEAYRDAIAKSSTDGGTAEADALATYVILRSDKVPEVIDSRLKAASTITDALALLRKLD